MPKITREHHIRFAIASAWQVCDDSVWRNWAKNWLDGSDRSKETAVRVADYEAAHAAADAARGAACAAACAAIYDAACAARAARAAAAYVADAATARVFGPIDFIKIADWAVTDSVDIAMPAN